MGRDCKGVRYSAVIAPMKYDDPDELIDEYVREAKKANVMIAEVGAWSNPCPQMTILAKKH